MAHLLITPGTAEPVAADGIAAPPGRRRASRLWVVLLVAGWLCQAGLRAWFGRMQVMPLANPDETAYLIAARVLAGGPGADLSGSTLYPGGYPLLITPVYWFTSNPATVYHAVLMINAAISAAVLPLGYLACRRLGLDRPAAYGVATVAALVPAGFFYSQYAMTDAVFPVITLAWLLATHSWLAASSVRGRYAAAAGSALLAGFAYMVHSRGLVLLAGCAAVGAFIAWRRPAARGSVAAAALIALGVAGAAWGLNHYLASTIYPEGARSLSGQMTSRLHSVQGTIHVFEMATGQLWRLVLDSWGIAGIGLVAALAVIARRDVRTDLRIMAGLAVAVTAAIACTAPAALLVAVAQMTSQVSQASTVQAQAVNVPVGAGGVRPGEQVAVSSDVAWQAWVPLTFQVSWTELQFFNPVSQPPPAGVTVVEMPWPDGQHARASWPHAPAGWRVGASNQAGGWVLWRKA